jgi:hypothetical protein
MLRTDIPHTVYFLNSALGGAGTDALAVKSHLWMVRE